MYVLANHLQNVFYDKGITGIQTSVFFAAEQLVLPDIFPVISICERNAL